VDCPCNPVSVLSPTSHVAFTPSGGMSSSSPPQLNKPIEVTAIDAHTDNVLNQRIPNGRFMTPPCSNTFWRGNTLRQCSKTVLCGSRVVNLLADWRYHSNFPKTETPMKRLLALAILWLAV